MNAEAPQEEARLVRTAAACDDLAFGSLMDAQRQGLRLTVSKYARAREDQEDLESEITVKLLQDEKRVLRDWKPIAPFAAYLCTISIRHCLDWTRRISHLPGREMRALAPSADHDPDDLLFEMLSAPAEEQPDRQLMAGEVQQTVSRGVKQLSERDQLVLRLRFGEGLKGVDVARVLGISSNAANLAVFKALRRLERTLDRDAPDLWQE